MRKHYLGVPKPPYTRLKRPCRTCEEMFTPTGKGSWKCEKCIKEVRKKNSSRLKGCGKAHLYKKLIQP